MVVVGGGGGGARARMRLRGADRTCGPHLRALAAVLAVPVRSGSLAGRRLCLCRRRCRGVLSLLHKHPLRDAKRPGSGGGLRRMSAPPVATPGLIAPVGGIAAAKPLR